MSDAGDGYTLHVKLDPSQLQKQLAQWEAMFSKAAKNLSPANTIATRISAGTQQMQILQKQNTAFSKITGAIETMSKRTMALVGIGAGIGGLLAFAVKSSPILQQSLKLFQYGFMFILRPIGDFIGMILRPIAIMFLRNAIPFYQKYDKILMQLGSNFGSQLAKIFADPTSLLLATTTTLGGAIALALANSSAFWSKFGGYFPKGGSPPGGGGGSSAGGSGCIEICDKSAGNLAQGIGNAASNGIGSQLKSLLPLAVGVTGGVAMDRIVQSLQNNQSSIDTLNATTNANLNTLTSTMVALNAPLDSINQSIQNNTSILDADNLLLLTKLMTIDGDLGTINTSVNNLGQQLSSINVQLASMYAKMGSAPSVPNNNNGILGMLNNPLGQSAVTSGGTDAAGTGAVGEYYSLQAAGLAGGGAISEPVFGMGMRSGKRYSFGEQGTEYVSPSKPSAAPYQPTNVNVYIGSVNNGMDVTKLKALIAQSVQQAQVRRGKV